MGRQRRPQSRVTATPASADFRHDWQDSTQEILPAQPRVEPGRWLVVHPHWVPSLKGKTMTKLGKLFATTALISALAAPALAEGALGLTIDLGLDPELSMAAPDAEATPITEADAAALTGRAVVTSDGVLIGHVSEAEPASDTAGAVRMVVLIDGEAEAEQVGQSFAVVVAADPAAEGDVTLNWTQEELMASIAAQLETQANTSG
jgi:hypothetical protein